MPKNFGSLNPSGGGDGAYSYKGRDYSSRAAKRDRRFGATDITGAGSFHSKAPISIKSLPLNWNAIHSEAVPVEGTADIGNDGTVDLRLKTSLSRLSNARAESAAEKLEPVVPHYLELTQPYTTRAQQKYYTWAGKPGQTAPPSRIGDYNVPTGNANVDADLAPLQADIKDSAVYIANRKAYQAYDEEDTKPYKYQFRTRRRKNDEETPEKRVESAVQELPLIEPKLIPQSNPRPPFFDVQLRSHTVWENMTVKFTCRVDGNPAPLVTWYHNMIPIEPALHPVGKFKITERNGVQTLEITRCQVKDAGTYRVSVQNYKGEISSYASLVVKRYESGKYGYYDIKSGYNLKKPSDYPDVQELNVPGYPRFNTKLYNQSVWEGDAITLACHVDAKPSPNVFWTLNGKQIETEPERVKVHFDGVKATVSILRAYTDYEGEWCCRAYNSVGASVSKMFLYVRGRGGPPSAPTGLEVVETTRDHIMLTWKRPGFIGHFGGAEVDGYFIEYAAAGSVMWSTLNTKAIGLARYPVTGLEEGKAYFFRARAVNRWGKSQWCKAIGPVACRDSGTARLAAEIAEDKFSLMPPEAGDIQVFEDDEVAVPEIPENCRVHSTTMDGTICVAFDAVEGECDGYYVEYSAPRVDQWTTYNEAPILVAGEAYPISGLEMGRQYQFRVRAHNEAGFSDSSMPTEAVWCGEPLEEGDAEAEEAEESEEVQQVISADPPKCYSVCTDGTDFEGRYRGPPTPPRSVTWAKATREYVEVTWAPPAKSGGESYSYYLEKQLLGSGVWEFCNKSAITLNHYIVNGLDMGEKYIFRVRAVNSKGSSAFSDASEPVCAYDGIRPPFWYGNALSFFRLSRTDGKPDVTKTSVKVAWEEPQRDGGAPITGYYLEVREYGGKFRQVNNKALQQRHFTVDGLTPQRYYQFRVKAANVVGCGAYINLPGRVFTDDPAAPGRADWLEFTNVGDDFVELKWEGAKDLGDGEFKGYIIEKCKEGSDLWIPCNKAPELAANCRYRVDNLVQGQTYFFRVRAVSSIGEGEPSAASCFVTPGEPLQDVLDRQNAMYAERRRLEALEEERRLAALELERRVPFKLEIQDQWMETGSRAFFVAEVKEMETEVDWFLGNWKETKVEPNDKFHIISVGTKRVLIIDNITQADACIVHCVCKYNGYTSTADLCVDGFAPVRFIKYFGDTWCQKGDTVVLHANLSKHTAKVTWKKITAHGGEQVLDESNIGDKYEIIEQGGARSLIIHDVQYEDIGQYYCGGFGGEIQANLVVDGMAPVYFDSVIQDQIDIKYTAEYVEFGCTVKLNPVNDWAQPHFQWFLNGEELDTEDERVEIVSVGLLRSMRIYCPRYQDSGEVTAYNPGGQCTAKLEVEPPPPPPPPPMPPMEDMVLNFLQPVIAEQLVNGARLFCVISNLTDDTQVQWLKNAKPLKQAERYTVGIDPTTGVVSLEIAGLTAMDMGRYTASFTTPLGMFDTKVHFDFTGSAFDSVLYAAQKLKEEEEQREDALNAAKQRELAEAQAALQAEIDAANAEQAEDDDGEGEAGEVPMQEPVEQAAE